MDQSNVIGHPLIGKVKDRTKETVNQRVISIIDAFGYRSKAIIADNGTELHGYQDIERAPCIPFYLASRHHSWERGTTQNTNSYISQYLLKRTSMAALTQHHCNNIA